MQRSQLVRAIPLTLILVFAVLMALTFTPTVSAAGTIYVRPGGDDTNCDGTLDVDYPGSGGPGLNCAVKTIEKGINLVDSGGTVNVAAGSYSPSANINKPVTLRGAQAGVDARDGRPGASESLITKGGAGTFSLNATDITFDGFTFTNMSHRTLDTYFDADRFTMRNCILQGGNSTGFYQGGSIQFGGGSNLHADGLVFEQNLVLVDNGYLFYMGHSMDNGTVRNNKFNGDSVSFGPFGERTGWLIEGNEFDGNVAGHGPYWGFGFNANLGDVTIRNNIVRQMVVGIGQISVVNGSITGNTFDDNDYAAFQLWGGEYDSVVSSNVLIENNWIRYNGVAYDNVNTYPAHGIRLRPAGTTLGPIDASTIHMHENFFDDLGIGTAGSVWAIRQQGSGTADAENNWWGTTDGSVIATMIGEGAADYDPWIVAYADDPAKVGEPGFWPLALCSTDCYIDAATGDDAYPGTEDLPFLTIQQGIDTVATGGTVHVANGTYIEQVVIDGKDLTLKGQSLDTIIQAPNSVPTCFTTSAANKPIVCIKDATATIDNFTVDGAGKGNANNRFSGVAFRNAAGTLKNSTIKDIRNSPFDGAQHGVAIYAYNDDGTGRTINVWDNTVTGFQKNAMALNAGDTTPLVVDVRGNIVTGYGTTTITAQNGIQVWAVMGSGTIDGNTISGIAYDASSWVATAILNVDRADLNITNNTITGSHLGIYNIDGEGQINGNILTVIKAGGYGAGIVATDPPEAAPSPFGADEMSQAGVQSASVAGVAGVLALDVSGNTVTFSGTDNSSTYGIEADAGYGPDDIAFTANGNTVSGFEVGIEIWQCQSSCDTGVFTSVVANDNCLAGNDYGMRSNVTYLTVDGRSNWWGDASGPFNATTNPGGLGSEVSADIDFVPWVIGGCGSSTLVEPELSASTDDALFCTGEETDVFIDLAAVANLYGYEFEVGYDSTYASAVGFFVDSFFDTTTNTFIQWDADCTTTSGTCQFAATKTATIPPAPPVPAISGSGPLAKITLTGLNPGVFDLTIDNSVLSDIDGFEIDHDVAAPLEITVCGLADISGFVTLQGRVPNKDIGTVKMTEQTTTDFGAFGPVDFSDTDGAYSIQVPYMPIGGTTYKILAEHSLYLPNEDTILVTGSLSGKNTRLWGGDANNSGNISVADLTCIGNNFGLIPFGVCGATGSPDINKDDRVNIQDLSITGGNLDKCNAQPWDWVNGTPVVCSPIP